MIDNDTCQKLINLAQEVRLQIIKMMGYDKVHHFGGSLSSVEIITSLYFYKLHLDPGNPHWEDRDRFIMSKGHSVPSQYVALAMLGFFPLDELKTIKKLGSILQGHPNANLTPGIEAFTGSLGMGLSFGNGVAIAARLRKKAYRTYVLLGDGELQEGQVWEAAMTTSTQHLNSLTAIIDNNHLKSQGRPNSAKELEPLADKWKAFNWHVITIDGHDVKQICDSLDESERVVEKPTLIIANTIKGKGVSFMEDHFEFHNSAISKEQWELAMLENSK